MSLGIRDIVLIAGLSGSFVSPRADVSPQVYDILQKPLHTPNDEIHYRGEISCGQKMTYYMPALTTSTDAYTLKHRDGDVLIVPFFAKNIPDALEIVAKDAQGKETVITSTTGYLGALGKHPGTSSGTLVDGANHGPLLICGERNPQDTSTYRLLETSELPSGYTENPEGVGVLIGHIPDGTKEIIIYIHPNPYAITLGNFTLECFGCDIKMKGLKESYCYDDAVHLSIDVGNEFLNRLKTFEVIWEKPDGSLQTGRTLDFAAGTYQEGAYSVKALLNGCVVCEEEFTFTLRREEPFSAELDPLPGALCRTEETDMAVSVFSPAQASLFSIFAPLVDQDTLWFIPQSTVGEHHRFVSKRPLQGFETGQDLVVYVTLGGCALTLSPKIATCCTAQNAGYFPNAFSPNNDGYNDTYQIALAPHHHLRALEIFDRRGNQVFHQGPAQDDVERIGIHKGMPIANGVYVYYARIQCPDGREVEVAGDVTVVR